MAARALALDLVLEWQRSSRLADDLVKRRLDRSRLAAADKALVHELFYGWLRQQATLARALKPRVTRPPRREIQAILELGAYQILYLERIPPHAAVNEAVALAKSRTTAAEGNFVNAILRQVAAEKPAILEELAGIRAREPWVYYSHPQWLWERWQARWGTAPAAALCAWNNQVPPLYLRLNTLRQTTPPAAAPTKFHPLVYRAEDPAALFASAAWSAGHFYLQDPSTLLAVDLLDPQAGEAVLDVCAAPGGKTTYIAQKMQNRGRIIAADSSGARLQRVGENCRRLGVTIVATLACRGTSLNRCLRDDRFDRVLVDAPCSNTGVLRRRPDLRWRLTERELARLAGLQGQLLAAAATFVRPGGVLVYSTCSLEPEENEGVVAGFLEGQPGFTRETTRTLFPPRDEVDGAFVARLRAA